MKGKIVKEGWLQIQRKGEFKEQYCPKRIEHIERLCGDWCPLFGEPEVQHFTNTELSNGHQIVNDRKIVINICQDKQLRFDEFEDERE